MADTQDTPAPIEIDEKIDMGDVKDIIGAGQIVTFKLNRHIARLTTEIAARDAKITALEAKSITRTIEDVAEEIAGKSAEASVNGKAKP